MFEIWTFFETPNYEYLRKLFRDLMQSRNYINDDNFDWLEKLNKTSVKNPMSNSSMAGTNPNNANSHPTVRNAGRTSHPAGVESNPTFARETAQITTPSSPANVDVISDTKCCCFFNRRAKQTRT